MELLKRRPLRAIGRKFDIIKAVGAMELLKRYIPAILQVEKRVVEAVGAMELLKFVCVQPLEERPDQL